MKMSYIIINKNKTSFRSLKNINNIKCTSFDNKKYGRSRFNFIKRTLGIEQKKTETNKNDSNDNLNTKKNINDYNDKKVKEDKDEGCIIL